MGDEGSHAAGLGELECLTVVSLAVLGIESIGMGRNVDVQVLNRAAAVAMRDGPVAGLALIDIILARGDLADYPLAHSARAELCRRLRKTGDARVAFERALCLTRQEPQRRFLERRLAELRD